MSETVNQDPWRVCILMQKRIHTYITESWSECLSMVDLVDNPNIVRHAIAVFLGLSFSAFSVSNEIK